MRRLHLIEIEDQPWCPSAVRQGATDYLQFIIDRTRPYDPLIPRMRAALERTASRRIVDLCSGGGGPWIGMCREVDVDEVILTDRYPNLPAFLRARDLTGGKVRFNESPVDATRVPAELVGFRTLFSSFHHFRPRDAILVLSDAVERRQPIGVFEATQRRPAVILGMLLVPLVILAVTLFIRPLRWSRLFWTYLVPLIPLIGGFDGVVSCLRTYTPQELFGLTEAILNSGYEWEIGEEPIPGSPVALTYLIGCPSRG